MADLLPEPSLWHRVRRGAVSLCALEKSLLLEFVERMPVNSRPILLLPVRDGEVKLLSIAAQVVDVDGPLRAAFWAVDRRFFMVNFGCSIRPYTDLPLAPVEKTRQSWRSNVEWGASPG